MDLRGRGAASPARRGGWKKVEGARVMGVRPGRRGWSKPDGDHVVMVRVPAKPKGKP